MGDQKNNKENKDLNNQEVNAYIQNEEEASKTTDPIYEDLKLILQVYTIDKFEKFIIEKAVVLLDAKEDLLDFCIKAIDDEIEELKEFNKAKKFVQFTEEMISKVSPDEQFYAVIIQPYIVVQLKKNRDEFIAANPQGNVTPAKELNSEESPDEQQGEEDE